MTKVQGDHDLAFLVLLAGRNEADEAVERLGAAFGDDVAGQELRRSLSTRDVGDEPYRFTAVPATLMSLVDQQLPEEPRPDDSWWG